MLSVQHLVAGYGEKIVLRDVSLEVAPGEFVVLLGRNGSGKTTFLRTLAGILAFRSGRILLDGKDLRTLGAKSRARLIACVPQRPDIPRGLTVWDLVLLGRFPHLGLLGFYSKRDIAIAEESLRETDTYGFRDRLANGLSGGEMQRVLLAMALAQESRILLVDELGAGLDVQATLTLFSLLRERTKRGYTVLAVMHDYNIAQVFATRLLGFSRGQKIFDEETERAFTEKNLSDLYEVPVRIFQPEGTSTRLGFPEAFVGRKG